jgi:hypothetical protein
MYAEQCTTAVYVPKPAFLFHTKSEVTLLPRLYVPLYFNMFHRAFYDSTIYIPTNAQLDFYLR